MHGLGNGHTHIHTPITFNTPDAKKRNIVYKILKQKQNKQQQQQMQTAQIIINRHIRDNKRVYVRGRKRAR